MSVTLTNQVASPALRGQDALITLSQSDAVANIANIAVGSKAGVVSSGNIGYVSFVDPLGLYIKVKPKQDDGRFDSTSTPGILNKNELVSFNM